MKDKEIYQLIKGMDPTNTHFYDGQYIQWGDRWRQYFKDEINTNLSYFEICRKYVTQPLAIQALAILEQDNNQPNGPNWDPTSKIDAVELLTFCAICLEKGTIPAFIFEIQLIEMMDGLCAQGRVNRLAQI